MAMDPAGAAQALTAISDNTYLMSLGTTAAAATALSSWNMQIQGAYALLWPLIHLDYATRTEVANYVKDEVNTAFTIHSMGFHGKQAGPWAVEVPGLIPPLLKFPIPIPEEGALTKLSRPVAVPVSVADLASSVMEVELGAPQLEPVMVRITSPAAPLLVAT